MCVVTLQARPQDLAGGGAKNFFSDWKGRFGGMLPREQFLKWFNLVRYGVYFDQILSLKSFKNYHFL